ncbi:hypothetical protein ACTFIY_007840 [Dictyostelium cf. discoideum]
MKKIPFLIAGDINHYRVQIIEKLGNEVSFANYKDLKTTAGSNSIDHIMYSNHNHSYNFQVLKNATTSSKDAKINHYAIRLTFKLKKERKLYKEEKPRKNQNGKPDIAELEITNEKLCSKVKSKFKKEQKLECQEIS